MSLVTHKVPAWLAPSDEILQIWPVQIAPNCYHRLFQKFFLSSVTVSNWWLWIWVHRKMYTKNIWQFLLPWRCSSLQQELKFLCLQCIWNLVWNNWIGRMLEVILLKEAILLRMTLFCWEETHSLVWSFKANHSAYTGG